MLTLGCFCYYSNFAYGALAETNFNVNANVLAKCQIESINDLNFPDYDPFSGSDTEATTTMEVRCTNGLSYDIKLDKGIGLNATFAQRKMTSTSSEILNYTLLTSTDEIWGDGTDGSFIETKIATGNTDVVTIKGKIYQGQTPSAGSYSDTIHVTIDITPAP